MFKLTHLDDREYFDLGIDGFDQKSRPSRWPIVLEVVQGERGSTARHHDIQCPKVLFGCALHNGLPGCCETMLTARTSCMCQASTSVNKDGRFIDGDVDLVCLTYKAGQALSRLLMSLLIWYQPRIAWNKPENGCHQHNCSKDARRRKHVSPCRSAFCR